jgi:Transcriptional regulator
MLEELSTREKIILAGAEIIIHEGLKRFTAKNIANKIGITDAAIYKHFPSLDAIVVEIINRYISRCSQSVDRAKELGLSTEETLKQVMREHIKYWKKQKGLFLFYASSLAGPEIKSFLIYFINLLKITKRNFLRLLKRDKKKGLLEKILTHLKQQCFL